MRCIKLTGPSAADVMQAVANALDGLLGYPRQESEATADRRGGGRHVPWEQVRTERWSHVLRHPSTGACALPIADLIAALAGRTFTVRYRNKDYIVSVSVAGEAVTITVNGTSITETVEDLASWAGGTP